MKRATIIRRSLVGLVCTVGVGALYLAPSLAGPPEQIAVPAPTELPTMEPTPFESPTDLPTPFESTTPEPFPTETTVSTAPTSDPTTLLPTTEATTAPPYVPPKTSKPKKAKTTKPPKIALGSVTVTISEITPEKFTAKWTAVDNTKKFDVSGCGLKSKTITAKSQDFKFPSGKKCSFKINASGSGSYKDGPTETTVVKPIYAAPVVTIAGNDNDNSFIVNWELPESATTTKYEMTTDCVFGDNPAVSGVEVYFPDKPRVCFIKVRALADDEHGLGAQSPQIKVEPGVAQLPTETPSPGG